MNLGISRFASWRAKKVFNPSTPFGFMCRKNIFNLSLHLENSESGPSNRFAAPTLKLAWPLVTCLNYFRVCKTSSKDSKSNGNFMRHRYL